jgi:hypothetical protein
MGIRNIVRPSRALAVVVSAAIAAAPAMLAPGLDVG